MEKIARICWNTNEWKCPSGVEGKSLSKDSFEAKNRFGHEEWLFDETKVIDGYNYGYIQAINTCSNKHVGKCYDIHLFTISPDKQRQYVGCLHNVIGLSRDESKQIYDEYKKLGWIEEMESQIKGVRGNPKALKPEFLVNVMFKLDEAEINYGKKPTIRKDSIVPRYNLMNKKGKIKFEHDRYGK